MIKKFCENAKRVMCNSTDTNILKDLTSNDEVFRSIYNKDGSAIFHFNLGFKETTTLKTEIQHMKTIELFYPKTFTWRFNGQHIEALGLIPVESKYLGILSRYKGIENFIKYLRNQMVTILKYRNLEELIEIKNVKDYIFATGSLNSFTNLYVINVNPTQNLNEILAHSNSGVYGEYELKILELKYWIKEINPDFFRIVPKYVGKKYPVTPTTFSTYPPCITKIARQHKKGNYGRFLLATFLLGMHHERDAKHQLDLMLTDEERIHMNKGNCKDQWRAILIKKYSPPSCKTMIESGFCKGNCGQPSPIHIEKRQKNEI